MNNLISFFACVCVLAASSSALAESGFDGGIIVEYEAGVGDAGVNDLAVADDLGVENDLGVAHDAGPIVFDSGMSSIDSGAAAIDSGIAVAPADVSGGCYVGGTSTTPTSGGFTALLLALGLTAIALRHRTN